MKHTNNENCRDNKEIYSAETGLKFKSTMKLICDNHIKGNMSKSYIDGSRLASVFKRLKTSLLLVCDLKAFRLLIGHSLVERELYSLGPRYLKE